MRPHSMTVRQMHVRVVILRGLSDHEIEKELRQCHTFVNKIRFQMKNDRGVLFIDPTRLGVPGKIIDEPHEH
jgi:hypothetical protein